MAALIAAHVFILGALFPSILHAQVTPTATILASSANPALTGAPVTFTATVLGASPAGSVTFMDGTDTLGTADLSGPRATFTTSALAEGTHAISAVYGGDAANGASTSFALQQTVSRFSGVIAIAAGLFHTVVLQSDGSVVSWGSSDYGLSAIPAAATSGVVAVAAGGRHTVALKSDGSVIAWGSNSDGQITIPAAATSGVIAVAAGEYHTAVLKSDGSVVAWGSNSYGQTTIPAAANSGIIAVAAGGEHTVALKSDGSVVAWGAQRQTAIPATATSEVVAIAAGGRHTVALKRDGSVIAWGYNYYGQTTIPAAATSGVVAVAGGGMHTVALKTDGSIAAWGDNRYGQTTTPAAATSGVIAVAAGDSHTVALRNDGAVSAWGRNYDGQMPSFTATVSPSGSVAAGESVRFTASAGGIDCTWDGTTTSGTCASVNIITPTRVVLTATLSPNTFVDTWGMGCDSFTGTTCTIDSLASDVTISPVTAAGTVEPDAPIIGLATAGDTTANVSFEPPPSNGGGTIWWYTVTSSGGQSATGSSSPITVTGLTNATSYTFTVTATNCAGTGPPSEASNSVVPRFETRTYLSSSLNPALVGAPVTFTATVTGSAPTGSVTFLDGADTLSDVALAGGRATFTAAGLSEGQHAITAVYGGDAANGTSTSFVLQQTVSRFSGVIAIAGGLFHTVALQSDGSVVAWGADDRGQATIPAAATSGVTAVAAGGKHTAALKSDGSVIAWGDNSYGKTRIPAAAASGVIAVAAGRDHTLALKNDGSVVAWGDTSFHQTTIPAAASSGVVAIAAGAYYSLALKSGGSVIGWGYGYSVPAAASSAVVALAAGNLHVLALKSDGSVIAWGDNSHGQTTIPAAATTGVIAVAAGGDHSVALKSDGSVIAWGCNYYGQTTIPAAATSGVTAVAAGGYHTVALKSDGSVIAWGGASWGQTVVPSSTVTVNPSGPVPAGAAVVLAGSAGGLDCTWDGRAVSGTCASAPVVTPIRVVLTATLPPNTFVDTWGAGCDSFTGTTCTVERLASNTTISPVTALDVVVPGAPVIGAAQPGDTEVTVAFEAPASNGGGTIWWYTVTSSGGQTASGPSSPVTVGGLTNGAPYTFTVTATNTAGTGPASAESNSAVPRKATSAILSSSANPSLLGALLTFTATVTGTDPTGTVTFLDGGDVLGTTPVSGSRATFTTSTLGDGEHTIMASYGGDGTNATSLSLALRQVVTRYAGVVGIAAGNWHTLALKSDGSVIGWGSNYDGQTTTPTGATSGVVAVSAGGRHSLALRGDGSVVGWGSNYSGQTTIPVAASSGVIAISAGAGHNLALKGDGSVLGWGWGDYTQTTIPTTAGSGIVAIAAGARHSLALKNDGSVIAWGANMNGQTTVPVAATSGVVAISAGYDHNVALKRDGSVIAWGLGNSGQTAIPAAATAGVVAVAAGEIHTAALKSDGSVVVWGSSAYGLTTVPAEATSGVIAIAAGARHMVALKRDGSVVAWGDNGGGQATVPAFAIAVTPSGNTAPGETVVFSGSAGGIDCVWDGTTLSGACNSSAIITTTRVVLTAALPPNTFVDRWGAGCDAVTGTTCTIENLAADVTISPVTAAGTVLVPDAPIIGTAAAGDATTSVSFDPPPSNGGGTIWWYTVTSSGGQSALGFSSPIRVDGLTNGTTYTFSVRATNAAGTGPASEASNGVVPRRTTNTMLASSSNPALAGAPVTFTATVLGTSPTGTVTFMDGAETLGTAELSGARATFTTSTLAEGEHPITAVYGGDAANGPSASFVLPQNVRRHSGVIAIAAGYVHTVALNSDGSVGAWGDNSLGQTTVPPEATAGVVAIAAGGFHTVALRSDGSVVAWGRDTEGQTTIPAEAAAGVVAIAAGGYHTVALKNDGSVLAWGVNEAGQATVPSTAASGIVSIAAGVVHTVALASDGSVIAWGENSDGQTTIPAAATSGVVAIAAGGYHTVALKSDGSVVAWGWNYEGQTTVPDAATSGVVAIAAGINHTLALKSDGSVIAWGDNWSGQATVPAAATSGVVAIAAGGDHAVALKGDGSVIAWGYNDSGQSTVAYFVATVDPSGPVPAAESVAFTSNANGIDCTWDGTTRSGSCASVALVTGSRVALTAQLPAGSFVDSWGAGCEVMTPTTCTTAGLRADVTIAPRVAVGTPSVPDAPILVSAVAGDTRAEVSFSPPPSDGGGTIWFYTATSSDGQSAKGSSSPILVSGLANHSSYTFTVTATNAAGTGPASAPSNGVTPLPHATILASSSNPALPGAPVTFTAIVTGNAPTGTVTFMDGEGVLGSESLVGGRATYATSSLGAGLHPITAAYGGDGVNPVSVSNVLRQAVTAKPGVIAIAAGGNHTAALRSDGAVVAWGSNTYGQTTIPAAATSGVVAIAAGGSHTVALKADGSVVAWGHNGSGQTTIPAAATSGVVAIAAGSDHSVALKDDGSVVAWGWNMYGQTTIPNGARSGVVAIAASAGHTMALKGDGSVIVWGDWWYGLTSVPAAATSGVIGIGAGTYHLLALKTDGSVIAWGPPGEGRATVPGAATSGVVAVSAGWRHSLALKADGSVVAWGGNDDGQATVPASAESGVIAVAAGGRHSVALKNDGSVVSWGLTDGQPYSIVSVAPSGPAAPGQTVRVTSDVGGIDCAWDGTTASGSCSSEPILAMTRVVLTAELPPNTFVDSWGIGCDATTATTCTIDSLTADRTISPVTDLRHGLVVSVLPEAGGTVTAEGIACPGLCSALFVGPSPVAHLLATPAAGYVFLRWEGDASGADTSLDLSMTADRSVSAIFSTSRTVCPDGCDYADVQAAVDAAQTGDAILLGPGSRKLNLAIGAAKELTLRGTGATPAATVLDGDTDAAIPGGDGSVVSIAATEGVQTRVRIENLTLTGGKAQCGGGLSLEAAGTGGDLEVSLAQVVVRLNSAAGGTGGGICARAAGGGSLALDLKNVLVTQNRAGIGGGIYATAEGDGSTMTLNMTNDTVGDNTAGGGAYVSASANGTLAAALVNSILAGNDSASAADLSVTQAEGGSAVVDASFSDIRSRLVASGSLLWGDGMRTGSPVFRNPANGDFHLNADSPCIDRGTDGGAPAMDYEGNSRPQASAVDIGADEYRPTTFSRLKLLTLTGGERIAGGRPYDITWGAPATLTLFKVYVSTDGGATWALEALRGAASRHYRWTPPKSSRSIATYRVKVEGFDAGKALVATVRSARNFTVRKQ